MKHLSICCALATFAVMAMMAFGQNETKTTKGERGKGKGAAGSSRVIISASAAEGAETGSPSVAAAASTSPAEFAPMGVKTTKAEAADPYFTGNERLQTFVNLLPNAHFAPTVTGWEDTAKAVTNAAQSVYLGSASPEAALKKAETEANAALGK